MLNDWLNKTPDEVLYWFIVICLVLGFIVLGVRIGAAIYGGGQC